MAEHHAVPRVAVVGCGAWGANHLRVFAELGALGVACDTDSARLAVVRDRYASVETTNDVRDVFASASVDAVVLATPAPSHAALAAEAIASGKDVLVEKPMALSRQEAEDLCGLADRSGRIVAVGHVVEYHPAFERLRALVAAGELGRLRYLYANRLNFGKIRTEENVLWSFAPHDVAIILRLIGSLPDQVACHGASYLNPGVADVTLTHLQFAGGVQAHLYVSWIHPFKEHRFVVVGEQRIAVFDDTAPWSEKLVVFEHEVDWVGGNIPVARKAAGVAIPLDEAEPLRRQAEAFLSAVRTRVPPTADGRSGADVLSVLFAAQRSLDADGAPMPTGVEQIAQVHPTAVVDSGAHIGAGTRVWHYTHVMADAIIGNDCVLGQNVFVGRGVRIGNGVKLQNNVSVFEGVELEDGVFCGPSAVFTNVRNPRAELDQRANFGRTLVREGATIGANATIVCGVTLGRYCLVGAGAVVTSDVPDHALVLGSPARTTGWVCRCAARLPDTERSSCAACGRTYVVAEGRARQM